MRMYKRMTAMLLSLLTIVLLLPMQISAAEHIDLEKDVNLTITYQNDGNPVAGAPFDIYLLATADKYGELTVTENFDQFNINIRGENDAAWIKLASTVEGYILRDNIAPYDSGVTNEQGILTFPDESSSLKHGIYLIMGERYVKDGYIYETEPFVVQLPALDKENNAWLCDVAVYPKGEVEIEEPECKFVSRKVLKVWDDQGHEKDRPKEIIVQLLKDGELYEEVPLNAGNNWRHTWDELEENHRWNIVEKELDGYTVEVVQEGITFVVTNTCEETPPPNTTPPGSSSKLPQTGQLWWPVPVLAAAGLLSIIIGLLRRRGADYEK